MKYLGTSLLLVASINAHKLVHKSKQPIGGDFWQTERDSSAGYPSLTVGELYPDHNHGDVKDFVTDYIDKKTGGYKTDWVVSKEKDAEAEKKLNEAAAKPYFRVPADMNMDWDGDCYVWNVKNYGKNCSAYGNRNENSGWKNTRFANDPVKDANVKFGDRPSLKGK